MRIEKARQEFRIKNFRTCLETFEKVLNKDLMNNLDTKIIDFCRRHLED